MRPDKVPLLSPKSIQNFSALEFITYIKSLRRLSESKSLSKSVEGINISITATRLIIKLAKKDKIFTSLEIDSLSAEFKLDKQVLIDALLKRKVGVLDESGTLVTKPKPARKERNVISNKPRKRMAKDKNKLIEPGPDSNLSNESKT